MLQQHGSGYIGDSVLIGVGIATYLLASVQPCQLIGIMVAVISLITAIIRLVLELRRRE
ncbi:MAG: hypothetical protein QXS54_02065 [Candidatus Methanomethylicaceae archaeon]